MFWWGGGDSAEYYRQYVSFYVNKLIPVLEEAGVDITKNFMDTSPSNGVKSFKPYVKRNGFSP